MYSIYGMHAVHKTPSQVVEACYVPAAKFVPGAYAIKVTTPIPREVEEILEANNITWHLERGD